VTAYLGSHILAFDVQVHDGIPQIVSEGAGTQGTGPLALMPARTEYLHVVQMAVDASGLQYRVLDVEGKVREAFAWPFTLPASAHWECLTPRNCATVLAPRSGPIGLVAWRFEGSTGKPATDETPQTLLCGWDSMEGVATLWIGLEGCPPRLVVRLVPQSGYGWQTWSGPKVPENEAFAFQLALHPGMGPGGMLFRASDTAPWQSLFSTSSKGVEDLTWPRLWAVGEAQSGSTEWPFRGKELSIRHVHTRIPQVE
jgi:hypothetical protein